MEQVEETRSSGYSGSRAANDKTPLIRGKSTQSINGAASDGTSGRMTNTEGYEELFKDSAPCPTCRGLGRVSKGEFILSSAYKYHHSFTWADFWVGHPIYTSV